MNPFFNTNDLKGMIEKFAYPFANGFPFSNNEFENMISESLNQYMPGFFKTNPMNQENTNQQRTRAPEQKTPDYKLFETHEFVIVRVPLEKRNASYRLFLDSHQLTIKGADVNGQDLKIPLPTAVKPKLAKADYQGGILEVRMMKRGPEAMTEISLNTSE